MVFKFDKEKMCLCEKQNLRKESICIRVIGFITCWEPLKYLRCSNPLGDIACEDGFKKLIHAILFSIVHVLVYMQ